MKRYQTLNEYQLLSDDTKIYFDFLLSEIILFNPNLITQIPDKSILEKIKEKRMFLITTRSKISKMHQELAAVGLIFKNAEWSKANDKFTCVRTMGLNPKIGLFKKVLKMEKDQCYCFKVRDLLMQEVGERVV